MKQWTLVLSFLLIGTLACWAQSSDRTEGDISFGAEALTAGASNTDFQTMGGGTYLSFAGHYTVWHHLGAGADFTWRAKDNSYGGSQPFRPIFVTFDGIYAPKLGKHAQLEAVAGLGFSDTHFYTPYANCNYVTCTNYVSAKHMVTDFGAGLRLFVRGGVFVRPEIREYIIRNNAEFSTGHATRMGVSLGYAF